MDKRIYNILALVLLVLFFLPPILKLRELGLLVLLIGGLALPIYDLIKSWNDQ